MLTANTNVSKKQMILQGPDITCGTPTLELNPEITACGTVAEKLAVINKHNRSGKIINENAWKNSCESERAFQMPKPEIEYLNISKVANYISTENDLFTRTLQLVTIPKKNIFVTVDLIADKNLILTNLNITSYDMVVMDSVYTLYVNGAIVFTPEMVVRIMSGNLDQDVTEKKVKAVTASLRKLSLIRIQIECTNEFHSRKKIDKDQTDDLKNIGYE